MRRLGCSPLPLARLQRAARAPFGLTNWIASSPWKMTTSSIPGMVLTPMRFSVACSRLSSVVAVLCDTFFLLRRGVKEWEGLVGLGRRVSGQGLVMASAGAAARSGRRARHAASRAPCGGRQDSAAVQPPT